MSEVRLSASVKAQYMVNLPTEGSAPAGAFTYYVTRDSGETVRGMIYACPCGCGRHGALPFHPLTDDDVKYKRSGWQWNGERESPTLHPSVHHVGHWHGHLRNGFWEQA